jgi:REP element-mobilizing transposase RayT
MDRYLDQAASGPTWLLREEIAQLVVDSLQYADRSLQLYDLYAWVIMSNHVHLLLLPRVGSPSTIGKGLYSTRSESPFAAHWSSLLAKRILRSLDPG